MMVLNALQKEELRKKSKVKKQVADKYYSERFVTVLPALRAATEELDITRSEILLLLSAKTYQRKYNAPFSAKSIEIYSYISYKNMNVALTNLCEKGYLKMTQTGRGVGCPTLFALSYEGLEVVNRFDDLVRTIPKN